MDWRLKYKLIIFLKDDNVKNKFLWFYVVLI